MGLAPLIVERIFATIREVVKGGMTLLLVEQNAKLALSMCEFGYVMDGGTITLSGEARALLDNEALRKAYLGE